MSKPSVSVSLGRSDSTSTSSPNSDLISLAYSSRLSRCSVTWPGSGFLAPAASSWPSSQEMKDFDLFLIRPRLARRRHQLARQPADRLFPDRGILRDAVRCHRVERDLALPVLVVVAFDAIIVEHLELLVGHRLLGARTGVARGIRSGARREGGARRCHPENAENEGRCRQHTTHKIPAPRKSPVRRYDPRGPDRHSAGTWSGRPRLRRSPSWRRPWPCPPRSCPYEASQPYVS